MGAEPSEMLMTSLRERQAALGSRLPAIGVNPPPDIKPKPTNRAVLPSAKRSSFRGNEANNQLNSYRDSTSSTATVAASTASKRVNFSQIDMENDNNNETVAPTTSQQPAEGFVFLDVFQRTTVQDGQRVNNSHRSSRSIQMSNNQRTTTRGDVAWSNVASSAYSLIHAGDFPLVSPAPQGTNKKASGSSKKSKKSKRNNDQGNTNQQQSTTPITATSSLLDEPLIPLNGPSSSNNSVPAGLRGMSQLSPEPLIPSSRGTAGDGNTNASLSNTAQRKLPDEEEWLIDL